MAKLELISKKGAMKLSKIKSKHLEDHLLVRLDEYQRDLLNAFFNPDYYDYGLKNCVRRVNSVLIQLQGGTNEEIRAYLESGDNRYYYVISDPILDKKE